MCAAERAAAHPSGVLVVRGVRLRRGVALLLAQPQDGADRGEVDPVRPAEPDRVVAVAALLSVVMADREPVGEAESSPSSFGSISS